MKTLDRIKSDPRVDSAWSETGTGDGYWVNLKQGWADLTDDPWQPTHTIHEWSLSILQSRMKQVKPCTCKDCSKVRTESTR